MTVPLVRYHYTLQYTVRLFPVSWEELGYAYAINKRNAAPSPQTDLSPVLLLFISPLPSFENPEHGITSDNENSQQSQIPNPSIFSVYEY